MKIKANIDLKSKGHYSLKVLDADGNLKADKTLNNIDNVVTYEGAFESYFAGKMFGALYARVGTGTTERTRSSTDLGNVAGGISDIAVAERPGNEVDNEDGTSTLSLTREMQFSLGQLVGTFSEIGVYANTNNTLIAGQLIKDELGDPTTITLLEDEQLVVMYTLEWTVPNTSNLIGTGTVDDAESNSYPYEVWLQPFFRSYTIGANATATRWFVGGEAAFFEADGTTRQVPASSPSVSWETLDWNGTDTVTRDTELYTLSPSGGTLENVVFVNLFCGDYPQNTQIVDTDIALGVSSSSVNNRGGNPITIKFLTPFTKTDDDTFSIKVSVTINL